MFTLFEVVISLLAVVAILVGVQAHRDHLSFKAEAKKDIDAAKAEIASLKTKVALVAQAAESPATPAPVQTSTTGQPPATAGGPSSS